MNENSMILQDNLLYLNAWFSQMPEKDDSIQILDHQLLWNHDNITEQVSLKDFYLPTLLYNQSFQRDLQMNVLTPLDLFRIIRVHIYANEYKKEILEQTFITDFYITHDENGEEIIVVKNNLGKQFVIRNRIQQVAALYKRLKLRNDVVNMETLEWELEKI